MFKINWQKDTFKISMIQNVVIMQVFLTLNLATNFGNKEIGLTTIYLAASAAVMIIANYILYQYSKKKQK